jgi:hypothetical protein
MFIYFVPYLTTRCQLRRLQACSAKFQDDCENDELERM